MQSLIYHAKLASHSPVKRPRSQRRKVIIYVRLWVILSDDITSALRLIFESSWEKQYGKPFSECRDLREKLHRTLTGPGRSGPGRPLPLTTQRQLLAPLESMGLIVLTTFLIRSSLQLVPFRSKIGEQVSSFVSKQAMLFFTFSIS